MENERKGENGVTKTPLVRGNAKAFGAGVNDRPVDGQSRTVTEPAGETEGHVVARGFYGKNPPVFF